MSAFPPAFDRIYRRVRVGSEEHQLLERAWLSFDGTWEGVPILHRHQTQEGWVVFGFSIKSDSPEEAIDLLIGDPCNEIGGTL